jgi:hypothetical protein
VALGAVRGAGAAVCTLGDLCPGPTGNCTPSTKLECDSPAIFDLGGRPLVIPVDKAVTVSHGDGAGLLSISGAATLSLGGKILAEGDDGDSGQIVIVSAGPVTLAAGSSINTSADLDGGYIELDADSGDIQANGLLKATAGNNGEGGEVVLAARGGSVTVSGLGINASASGDLSGGGSVELTASADVSLLGPVDITGGDAGELDLDADGSVVTGSDSDIEASAKSAGGLGGSFSFLAGIDVRLAGALTATAPGNDDDGGGLGGEVLIVADTGSVELAGQLDLRGSGPDGEGGSLDLTATLDVTISGPVQASIDGAGFGGSITISAGGRTSLASTLDVSAGDSGGSISVESDDTLTVQGTLNADATGNQGTGGQNTLRACTLLVVHEGEISAIGAGTSPDASNVLRASGQMTISGTLMAGNQNLLEYRDTPPTISAAVINPKAQVQQDASLPCCGDACTPPTTTLAPPTTSTSTTTPGTTATTAPPGTSTTTTTTTITLPPTAATSTSSTVPTSTPPTTAPPPCLDEQPGSFDAADCRLQLVSEALAALPPDALGGKKLAKTLQSRVSQAERLVTGARTKARPAATLRRAKKRLRSFANLVKQGQRRRKIGTDLETHLVGMAGQAVAAIDAVLSSQGPTGRR